MAWMGFTVSYVTPWELALVERNVHRHEPLELVCGHPAVERNGEVECDVRLILSLTDVEEVRIKAMTCL